MPPSLPQLCPASPPGCFPGLHTELPTAAFHFAVLHYSHFLHQALSSLSKGSRAPLQQWRPLQSQWHQSDITDCSCLRQQLSGWAAGEENLVLWATEQPCWHVLGLFPTIPVLPAVKSSGQRYLDISCASCMACTFPNNFNSWGVLGKDFRKSWKISKSLCLRTGQFADLQLSFSRGSVCCLLFESLGFHLQISQALMARSRKKHLYP